jgi:quinol monooxygenase YgiN
MIALTAQFTMKDGKVREALELVGAVRLQSDREQPGTLLYLVHRVLDAQKQPTRDLLFYESYLDQAAVQAHLDSSSWKALVAGWSECFEGSPASNQVTFLDRLGGFVHTAVS